MNAHRDPSTADHHDHGGLVAITRRFIVGLAVFVAAIFAVTVFVEAVAPALPGQANAAPVASMPVQHVEHFHAQFNLKPGVDTQGQPDAF
jgi:hypothetical protein